MTFILTHVGPNSTHSSNFVQLKKKNYELACDVTKSTMHITYLSLAHTAWSPRVLLSNAEVVLYDGFIFSSDNFPRCLLAKLTLNGSDR